MTSGGPVNEHVSTTLTSYGSISPHRQGELVRSMADQSDADAENRVLFDQFMRLVRGRQGRAAADQISRDLQSEGTVTSGVTYRVW